MAVNRVAESGSPRSDRSSHHRRSEVELECYNSSRIPANARHALANSYLFRLHQATSECYYELDSDTKEPYRSLYLTLPAEQRRNHFIAVFSVVALNLRASYLHPRISDFRILSGESSI
jgi:hypothetical protein